MKNEELIGKGRFNKVFRGIVFIFILSWMTLLSSCFFGFHHHHGGEHHEHEGHHEEHR